MKRTTVKHVVRHLFYDLLHPFAILGQSHCINIEIGGDQFVLSLNENKLMFLKIMPQQLFSFATES